MRRAVHLGEPVGVAQLGLEAGRGERVQGRPHVLRADERVEVLAVAPHAGEPVVRVRAAECVLDARVPQDLEPAAEELRLRGSEVQRPDDCPAPEGQLEVAGAVVVVIVCREGAHQWLHFGDSTPPEPLHASPSMLCRHDRPA